MHYDIPLNTVGRIAKQLNVPSHRVTYVIDRHSIKPIARAGRFRLFDRAAVARIRYEITRIDAHHCGERGGDED